MTGARRFARDYIAPLMRPGLRVLDVCCGDGWVFREWPEILWRGDDRKRGRDLTDWAQEKLALEVWKDLNPDLIISVFGLQHLLSEEARVWTLLRRIAKPETKFVYVGRYRQIPCRETDREDPLNAYNSYAFDGIALASGWKVVDFKTAIYDGERYALTQGGQMNAFAATLEPLP